METPLKRDDLGGKPTTEGNTHMGLGDLYKKHSPCNHIFGAARILRAWYKGIEVLNYDQVYSPAKFNSFPPKTMVVGRQAFPVGAR